MAAFKFRNDLSKGINLDLDESRLPPDTAVFLKNITRNVNTNAAAAALAGSNQDVSTPVEGCQALTISGMPSGTNYCIGYLNSEQTNELYFFVYNSATNHTIWVISGDTGVIQKVYQGALLQFQLNPKYFIAQGRSTLELRSRVDPTTGLQSNFKFLIFTFNYTNQFLIEVNSSIATSSYSTSFFTSSAAFYNPLELVHLGVPTPLVAMGIDTPNAYTPTTADAQLQNMISRNGWQFRIKTVDFYGRESEHGIISDTAIVLIGGGCISLSNGLPRCFNLNFDAGNPMVDVIQIEYRKWTGDGSESAIQTDWLLYEAINKYDNSTGEWYTRSINPLFTTAGSGMTFNAGTNMITYAFCADKNSIPIDSAETSRTEPELPRISSSVFSIAERIGLANNIRDFEPIAQSTIDKVTFGVQPPATSTCASPPTRTITFYANIYSGPDDQSSLIRSDGALGWVFGRQNGACQIFGDQKNPGFIGYLAGTPYKCISSQGDYNYLAASPVFTPQPLVAGSAGSFPNSIMQQFIITDVPAGKYVIRIASHHTTVNDPNYQETSTHVVGLAPINHVTSAATSARQIWHDVSANPYKEMEIDCTSGDVTIGGATQNMFVILDLTSISTQSEYTPALDGYLYEETGGLPVEMNPILYNGESRSGTAYTGSFGSAFTDHNGYFFMGANKGIIPMVSIYTDFCDGNGLVLTQKLSGTQYTMQHGTGIGTSTSVCGIGSWLNQVYLAGPATGTMVSPYTLYPASGRRLVKQRFATCASSTVGVPGIPVVMTKVATTAVSDSGGNIAIYAHNRYNYASLPGAPSTFPLNYALLPNFSTSPNNQDKLVISQKGGCTWVACGGCSTSMSDITISYLACGANPSGCSVSGQIATYAVNAGGSGYVIGNTFTVNGGSTLAVGVVTGVTSGAVTGISITSPGAGYSAATGVATTHTSGSGTGLTINILTLYPPQRTTCLTDITLNVAGTGLYGVQSGGKYPVAFWLHDVIGRHTAPQVRQGATAFVNIPNLNDVGQQMFGLSQINFNIDSSFAVDPMFTKMTFLVGGNVLFTDFFSWAADWIQPVDATGATNSVNPVAIRIYYGSLNEYKKANNFSVNCDWQFITDQSTTSGGAPVEGDVVQFIMNGYGTTSVGGTAWLPSVLSAPVTYDSSGSFFTIEYLPELANLTNGCLFRVIRPSQDTSSEFVPLFEQSLTIDLVGGVPQVLSGVLPYEDSYLLSRLLPVPRLKGQPNAIPPNTFPTTPVVPVKVTSSNQDAALDTSGYSTSNINNANGVVIFDLIDDSASFAFFFESPSPSDFYGSHLASRGRVGVANPYERQLRIGTEIALSDTSEDRSTLNGLSYFESQNAQTFDRNTWGNIVTVLNETSEIMAICESDHFRARYNTTQLRVDANNNVLAQNPNGIFTQPERKNGQNFGCIQSNINTVVKYGGTVVWLDAKGHLVFSNFSDALPVEQQGYMGYLLNKIADTNLRNMASDVNGLSYFHGSIDPKTMEYMLTMFNIPATGSPAYLNANSVPTLTSNETLVFDVSTGGILKCFPSFTPEMYAPFPGYYLQRNFLSFKNGVPYIHHNTFANTVAPPPYANFYGTQCECRITVVGNPGPDKVKRYFYIELYSRQALFTGIAGTPIQPVFYADVITTEKNQLSRIKPLRWVQKDGIWCSEFVNDLNTPVDSNLPTQTGANKLLDGNPLQGRWIKCSLVTQSSYAGSYFEVSSLVIYGNGVEKSIG